MHGMICKSLEAYLRSTHGEGLWQGVCRDVGLSPTGFEPLVTYEEALFARVLLSASERLGQSQCILLEDLGTWLCTYEPVRRLFRFCGRTYRGFLFSLEEMEARARMSLPDLRLPSIQLEEGGEPGRFEIATRWHAPGAGALLAGVLRAMASDHGALAVIETGTARETPDEWFQAVSVHLVREGFHAPRAFALVPEGP